MRQPDKHETSQCRSTESVLHGKTEHEERDTNQNDEKSNSQHQVHHSPTMAATSARPIATTKSN